MPGFTSAESHALHACYVSSSLVLTEGSFHYGRPGEKLRPTANQAPQPKHTASCLFFFPNRWLLGRTLGAGAADLTTVRHRHWLRCLIWCGHSLRGGRKGKSEWEKRTHRPVGSPCVAGRPARSCPSAGPRDCTQLLGSLKDQEENLIVVTTWT